MRAYVLDTSLFISLYNVYTDTWENEFFISTF